MTIARSLLGEFDHEMENTRHVLERVPLDRADWKPHPKSFSLGILAIHTAELAQWAAVTINQSELDFSPENGQKVVRAWPERRRTDVNSPVLVGLGPTDRPALGRSQ